MTRMEKGRQLLDELRARGGYPIAEFGRCLFTAPRSNCDPAFIHQVGTWRGAMEDAVLEQMMGRGHPPLPVFDRRDIEAAVRGDIEPLFPDGMPKKDGL